MIEIKCIAYKRGFMDSEVEAKSYRIEKLTKAGLDLSIIHEGQAIRPSHIPELAGRIGS
jgi:hypothetical protein